MEFQEIANKYKVFVQVKATIKEACEELIMKKMYDGAEIFPTKSIYLDYMREDTMDLNFVESVYRVGNDIWVNSSLFKEDIHFSKLNCREQFEIAQAVSEAHV